MLLSYVREDLLEHLRPSVRSFVGAKNLGQLYSFMYASQTHITIHIPKAHDKYYPLTPRDDNDKDTRKDKDKDKYNDKYEMTKRPHMCT